MDVVEALALQLTHRACRRAQGCLCVGLGKGEGEGGGAEACWRIRAQVYATIRVLIR